METVKVLNRILNNIGYVGTLALIAGLVLYSLNQQWDLNTQIAVYGGLVLLAIYLVTKFPVLMKGLGTRSGKLGSTAGVMLLLVLGILALLNYLNHRHHQRFDLSEGGRNSLSEQTSRVLSRLEQTVKVIGFYEDDAGASEFEDLLKEYRFAGSKLETEVVDPQKDPTRLGQYEIQRNGQVVIESGPRRQKIDFLNEENLTNAIIKVTREDQKTVYFLTGHGERDLADSGEVGYQAVKEAIEKQNYNVRSYNLAAEAQLPIDAGVLVVAGPETDFFPHETELLDTYLAAGGKLLLMADPENRFRMTEFLARYGLAIDDNVVIDQSGLGRLMGLSAAAPLVSSYESHPITEDLELSTFFPFARSVQTVESSFEYETETLFSSSPRSWGETELSDVVGFDEGQDKQGPLVLAVASTRTHPSDSDSEDPPAEIPTDDPIPAEASNPEDIASPGDTGASDNEEEGKEPERETRIVLVGDSDFVANRYLEGVGGNLDLFLNMLSWLAKDEDLIAVRPRDPTDRQVTLTERDSNMLFWSTVILLPLATLMMGVSVWYRRR